MGSNEVLGETDSSLSRCSWWALSCGRGTFKASSGRALDRVNVEDERAYEMKVDEAESHETG